VSIKEKGPTTRRRKSFSLLVGRPGVEPGTPGFSVLCSTN
jgi:hypothetical protein